MLAWSVALAKELGCKRSVVVVGPDMPELAEAAARLVGAENVAVQKEQLGTANAVDAAREAMKGADGHVIVLYADTPLVPVEAGDRAFDALDKGASVCVLGFRADLPNRYGRLVTAGDGSLEAIVEANDADSEPVEDRAGEFGRDGGAGEADVRTSQGGEERQRQEGILPDRPGRPGARAAG